MQISTTPCLHSRRKMKNPTFPRIVGSSLGRKIPAATPLTAEVRLNDPTAFTGMKNFRIYTKVDQARRRKFESKAKTRRDTDPGERRSRGSDPSSGAGTAHATRSASPAAICPDTDAGEAVNGLGPDRSAQRSRTRSAARDPPPDTASRGTPPAVARRVRPADPAPAVAPGSRSAYRAGRSPLPNVTEGYGELGVAGEPHDASFGRAARRAERATTAPFSASSRRSGAGDRDRTDDIQLGKRL